MSKQTRIAEANDSDRPNDQHAVGFSVSLDDDARIAKPTIHVAFWIVGIVVLIVGAVWTLNVGSQRPMIASSVIAFLVAWAAWSSIATNQWGERYSYADFIGLRDSQKHAEKYPLGARAEYLGQECRIAQNIHHYLYDNRSRYRPILVVEWIDSTGRHNRVDVPPSSWSLITVLFISSSGLDV